MLYSGVSTNVMIFKVMIELWLTISRHYRNVQVMDSKEEHVCGIIKRIEVHLQEYPKKMLTMDVVVVD